MALTYTPDVEEGKPLPPFAVLATDGVLYNESYFENTAVSVVMFICNHCPYVQAIEERLVKLASNYKNKNVKFLAVSSNDPQEHPEDSFENMRRRATEVGYPFAYLFDETQKMARDFGAVCTPDFFVYDSNHQLMYRGRLDDNWKNSDKVTRNELKEAIDALLANKPVMIMQNPSMGCSIKWF